MIVDGKLQSAPAIKGKISKRAEISGGFTPEEVEDWVDVLNAGTLPFAIRKVEERTVEPKKGTTD